MASPEDFQKYHDIHPDPFFECVAGALEAANIITEEQHARFCDIVRARAIDEYKEFESLERKAAEEYYSLSFFKKLFTKPEDIFNRLIYEQESKL